MFILSNNFLENSSKMCSRKCLATSEPNDGSCIVTREAGSHFLCHLQINSIRNKPMRFSDWKSLHVQADVIENFQNLVQRELCLVQKVRSYRDGFPEIKSCTFCKVTNPFRKISNSHCANLLELRSLWLQVPPPEDQFLAIFQISARALRLLEHSMANLFAGTFACAEPSSETVQNFSCSTCSRLCRKSLLISLWNSSSILLVELKKKKKKTFESHPEGQGKLNKLANLFLKMLRYYWKC